MQLEQLFKECRKGSVTAQKYLFDKHANTLFLICRRYLKTNEQAREVMMNGFLNIFKGIKEFTFINDTASMAWMKKLVVNECLQELRKKHSFLQVAEAEAENIAAADDVLADMGAAEIYKLILQLPLGYRTIFNLYVMEQMSHREIADLLKITEGTSKSQLSRARQILQKLIEQQNREANAQIR